MQFKLLNFHKMVGGFATSLVGTFIPLMIYKATGSVRLAGLFIVGECLSRLIFNHLFRKFCNNYPQIALCIRIIPLIIYNMTLIFLDKFMLFGLIVCALTYGMSLSIKNNAQGVLLNYTSEKKTGKKIVATRIIEYSSAIIACVTGGLFIDWNQTALIILSVILYIVSVLPIFIYFIVNKTKKGFNKDFTSNVVIAFDKNPELKSKRKNIVKDFILHYFVYYFLFCVIDNFTSLYSLYLFTDVPTFTIAGYLTAVFYVANFLGVLSVEIISKKFDLKGVNAICAIICAVPIIIIPFLQSYVPIYLLIFIFGYSYSICSYFMMNSILTKCKYISANNRALLARQDGINVGKMITPLVIVLCGKILPVFFVMSVSLIGYAIYTLIMEEKMRKNLVDYIENNEIE